MDGEQRKIGTLGWIAVGALGAALAYAVYKGAAPPPPRAARRRRR